MFRYSERVKALFANPKGKGHKPENTNLEGSAADEITECILHIELNERGIIRDAGYTLVGSQANVATASQLIELMVGRSIEFCATVFNEETLDRALGGLPEKQTNAPLLPLEALQDAYKNHQSTNEVPDSPIVCSCLHVTRFDLEKAIREKGLKTLEDVQRETFASTGCRSCAPDVMQILDEINGPYTGGQDQEEASDPTQSTKDMLLRELIEAVLDGDIRPALAMDGGDIRVHALAGKRLELEFLGACDGCSSAGVTFRYFIEEKLHSLVDPELEIITISSDADAA